MCAGFDQFTFAFVPECEDVGRGCAAQNSGVNQACKTNTRNVARGAEYSFEVPDGFGAERLVSGCYDRDFAIR